MDLVDLIAEKRFLGQEFLTWLWYKSDERGGTIKLPSAGDIQVIFEKHMILEYGEGEALERATCQGLHTELREARTGLLTGKKLEQARIMLVQADYEYHLSLKGSLFEFRSVKLPKTMTGAEESDTPEAVEARLLDRMGLYEVALRITDELFRMFLKVRIGQDWPEELAGIQAWINKER
jgi:hypothetical protein